MCVAKALFMPWSRAKKATGLLLTWGQLELMQITLKCHGVNQNVSQMEMMEGGGQYEAMDMLRWGQHRAMDMMERGERVNQNVPPEWTHNCDLQLRMNRHLLSHSSTL